MFLGGYFFDDNGAESKQLDVIVTTDTAPRFNFHNANEDGRSFSPVEGTLAVVSVKSTLDRAQLYDALEGLASIPPTQPLEGRINPSLSVFDYDDWPLKVIYASRGIAPQTLLGHINSFYVANPQIPTSRKVNLIHVAGSCFIARITRDMSLAN